ncbi:MAG: alcohol dehydrogenase catalytic domain-containing protein [Rubrobacteraceae bacterium]
MKAGSSHSNVPGYDAAGTVAAAGSNVEGLAVGDKVAV